ncbi:hypothetical protein HCG48_21795 [Oxynema aestuarii AP17]|uniref:Uncharacterized protein n=1 Tax=Oxynema aestuarii AP17 TaxID=2064643 RepID=A0A6H1U240_9CYAN|nr:hypothetical protein HCG48_21795 [Oxynema aestuarii AP17]
MDKYWAIAGAILPPDLTPPIRRDRCVKTSVRSAHFNRGDRRRRGPGV